MGMRGRMGDTSISRIVDSDDEMSRRENCIVD